MNLSSALGAVSAVGTKLSNIRQSPLYSAITTIGGFAGGLLVGSGSLQATQNVDFGTAFSQLIQGFSLVGQGTVMIATAVGVMLPIIIGVGNMLASTLRSQTKTVMATPAAPQVIAAVADSAAVLQPIVTTPEIAKASPSENVISK